MQQNRGGKICKFPHCAREIGHFQNLIFLFLDWDMVLENEVESTNEEPVDIVVRQQPSKVEPGAFYRNTRRMIVHQVQGVDVVKPSCGNCCILQ